MYNHTNQYRCTIIRGKAQKEMDDLLPAYAQVLDEICPCSADKFADIFDEKFSEFMSYHPTKKTLDNHRTEISGKLFGMYYPTDDGMVYLSDRTKKYIADNDAPAFFKDICYKMQFPNGSQKIQTVLERINNKVNIRPNSFLLKTMLVAKKAAITLTKKEIGYYVLNSLDVLQGIASPYEVIEEISDARKGGIERIISWPGRADSYNYQHINEQINLLELANLVVVNGNEVMLNCNEIDAINIISDDYNKKPAFDVYSYNLYTPDDRKTFFYEWDYFYSQLSGNNFTTSAAALTTTSVDSTVQKTEEESEDTTAIGDEGELYVYEYEKKRVSTFDSRLSRKVKHFGRIRGVGYDIQSVIAEPGENSEYARYIEVKSTKRVTAPNIDSLEWTDTINMTRNEWVAADQHKEYYSIYRVYFVRDSVVIYEIANPAEKHKDKLLCAVPIVYKVDFNSSAISRVIVN